MIAHQFFQVFFGRKIVTAFIYFAYFVSCNGDLEKLSRVLSSVVDLNADLIFVTDHMQECHHIENILKQDLPAPLFTCLKETKENFLKRSNQVGYIFLTPIEKSSIPLLETVANALSSDKRNYSCNPLIMLTTWEELNVTQVMEHGSSFPIDTNIYVFNYRKEKIYEIYSRRDLLVVREVKRAFGGSYFLSDKVRRRSNLMKSDFTATTVNDQTYYYWVNITNSSELLSGFSVSIYDDLKVMLNFTERVIVGDWIKNDANFTQLSGTSFNQLVSGEADMSITQQGHLPYRAKHIQFLQPTYQGLINAFFQQPETSSIRNIVTVPFQFYLWITLGCTWLLLIFSVKLILKLRVMSYWKDSTVDAQFAEDAMMWAVAASCQKSWYMHPTCTSMKLTFLIGYFKSVVCYVAYSAAIVSALAVIITPVNKFSDLLTFKYIFTVHKYSLSTVFFLQELQQHEKFKQDIVKVGDEDEISHLVNTQHRYAFLSSVDNFYFTAAAINTSKQYLCSYIDQVAVGSVPTKTGMFVKKGSEMTEILNYKIIMLKERGFNIRYMKYYDKITGIQCDSARDKLHDVGLSLTDMFTALLIVIIGFPISFSIVLVEIFYAKYTSKLKLG